MLEKDIDVAFNCSYTIHLLCHAGAYGHTNVADFYIGLKVDFSKIRVIMNHYFIVYTKMKILT